MCKYTYTHIFGCICVALCTRDIFYVFGCANYVHGIMYTYLCMILYMYTCMHYACTCMYMYIRVMYMYYHVYVYMHVCMYTYMYMYIHIIIYVLSVVFIIMSSVKFPCKGAQGNSMLFMFQNFWNSLVCVAFVFTVTAACVYIFIHICISIYICKYVYMYMYIYIYMCINKYVCIYEFMCIMCTHIHVYIVSLHICLWINIDTYICVYTYESEFVHTLILEHTHTGAQGEDGGGNW